MTDTIKMRKYSLLLIILTALSFAGLFSWLLKISRQENSEIEKVQRAATIGVKNYMGKQSISPITFTSCPLYCNQNGCLIGCYVDLTDFGVKHRTVFDVLLLRENRIWKTTIIKVENDQANSIDKSVKPAYW